MHIHLAPALAEVGVHAREDEEKKRLIHLVHRAKNFFDVARAISLCAAVREVECGDDFAVILRRESRCAEQRHHAREALDVFLHHDRRDRNARILGQAEFFAQRFGDLRVVRLRPDAQKILRQRRAGARTALADLHDAIRRLIEIRAREDEPGKSHIHAIARSGRQRSGPFSGRRGRQKILRRDELLRTARCLHRESALRLARPVIRHQLENLSPRLLARFHEITDQSRDVGLRHDVLCAARDVAAALGMHFSLESADEPHRAIGIVLHEFGDHRRDGGLRDLRHHLGNRLRGLGFLPRLGFDRARFEHVADVVIPDALHLDALRSLALLLRRDEGSQFVAHALVGDFFQLRRRRQISAREILEATCDEHARSEQPPRRIVASKFPRALLQTIHEPEAFAHGHRDAEQLPELANVVVREFAGHRVGKAEHIFEPHVRLLFLGEVGEELVVNLARQLRRHLRQLLANLAPVARDEAQEETLIRRQRARIGSADALKIAQQFTRIARKFLGEDRFELLEHDRVRPWRLRRNDCQWRDIGCGRNSRLLRKSTREEGNRNSGVKQEIHGC